MGLKSKVRSMQRGTHRRERDTPDRTPDYENFNPIMRPEDEMCLGISNGKLDDLLNRTADKVNGFKKAGFKKASDVSRLLNKAGVKTAMATDWSPRLVWFLMRQLHQKKLLTPLSKPERARSRLSASPIKPPSVAGVAHETMETKLQRLAAKWQR